LLQFHFRFRYTQDNINHNQQWAQRQVEQWSIEAGKSGTQRERKREKERERERWLESI